LSLSFAKLLSTADNAASAGLKFLDLYLAL
jgi:hypothetical protein